MWVYVTQDVTNEEFFSLLGDYGSSTCLASRLPTTGGTHPIIESSRERLLAGER